MDLVDCAVGRQLELETLPFHDLMNVVVLPFVSDQGLKFSLPNVCRNSGYNPVNPAAEVW